MANIEIWKSIPGYNDRYSISNLGRLKSFQKDLKPYNSFGYRKIKFLDKKRVFIHRLVAQLFIENPNRYPCVNHIDGNRSNNIIDNLEWCTHKQNTLNAIKRGAIKKGSDSPNSNLTKKQVENIRYLKSLKIKQSKISEIMNVSEFVIQLICSGKRYS